MECLKTKLKKEGSELTTNCSQLKMRSSDGKFYKTDVANTEQLLRLIQLLNMLAEASTTEILKDKKPKTFAENKDIAQKGGKVAKIARKQLFSFNKGFISLYEYTIFFNVVINRNLCFKGKL